MKSSDYWGIGFNRTKKLESKPKSFAIFTTISDEGVKKFQFQRAACTAAGSASTMRRQAALVGETRHRWMHFLGTAVPNSVVLIFFRSTWSYRMCPFLFRFILHSPNNVFRPETMCFRHCQALQVGKNRNRQNKYFQTQTVKAKTREGMNSFISLFMFLVLRPWSTEGRNIKCSIIHFCISAKKAHFSPLHELIWHNLKADDINWVGIHPKAYFSLSSLGLEKKEKNFRGR